MPYHLPDEDIVGTCRIEFDIPTDPKWATIIIGAISELSSSVNWEEGTGTLTVDEAIQAAIAIIDSVTFTSC